MKYKMMVKKVFKVTCLVVIGTFLVSVGQMSQYFLSSKDARAHTIAIWNKHNPNQTALSQLFIDQCLTSERLDKSKIKESLKYEPKFIGIYECGDSLGALELVVEIKRTDQAMHSLAWPLSVFNND